MALSLFINWEVRKTGSATNGAGFHVGASGSDMSVFDNKNSSGGINCFSTTADLSVTDGVTNGTTTITSATANFSTNIVGNLIYVSGGTGSIAGNWYEVISRTNATTIIVDRSTGLTTGTGVTLNIGGAADHVTTINSSVVAGNVVYVKYNASAYNLASTLTLTGGTVASGVLKATYFVGYDTTRTINNTDANQPIFASNGNALSPCITVSSYIALHNVKIDGSGATKAARGITASGSDFCVLRRCTVNTFTDCGILNSSSGYVLNCYVTAGTSAASNGAYLSNARGVFIDCVADSNANVGFQWTGTLGGLFLRCIATGQTTSNGQGFLLNSGGLTPVLMNCVAYNNASDGIRISGSFTEPAVIRNCALVSNGGYGINSATGDNRSTSNTAGTPLVDYNAFYNNTSGARNNVDAGTHDVTLTGVPFTNAGSLDFSLNNTASQGAACRAAGFPGVMLSGGTGYLDLGALQHQDASGGVSGSRIFTGF